MSNATELLDVQPKKTASEQKLKSVPKEVTKAEEKLPKYGILYFGDTMGKMTVINYLQGKVVGNENSIDPAKQLVIFNVQTKSESENNKVSKGLETLLSEFGTPNDIKEIPSTFKNHSDAYLHSFNNKEFIAKVIEVMGDEIRHLVFTFDNSCFTGLVGNFNVGQIETNTDEYNATRKDKHPVRLIYENSHKDLFVELQRYFEYIRTLFNTKKDAQAIELLNGNMEIDIEDMTDEKRKENAKNYFVARDTPETPLHIKTIIDNDPNKTFYVRQYK
jgi:hypothetical protein